MTEEEFKRRVEYLVEIVGNVPHSEYSKHLRELMDDCERIVIREDTKHKLPWMSNYRREDMSVKYMIRTQIHIHMRDISLRIHSL